MGGGASKTQDPPKGTKNVSGTEETKEEVPPTEEQLIEEVLDQMEENTEEPEIEQVVEKVPEGDKFVDTELERGVDKLNTPLTDKSYPPPPGALETHRVRIVERGYGKTRIEDSDIGTTGTPYVYKSFEGDPKFKAGVAKALKCVNHKAPSYEDLLTDLTSGLTSDKEKVIAIVGWMSQQNIGKRTDVGGAQESSPKGYIKLIQSGQGTYAAFFAILCRQAKIPCIIVQGYSKTVSYEVGEADDEKLKTFKNSWNVVHCDGAWCIINPLLVCKSLVKLRNSGLVVARSQWEVTSSNETPAGVLNSPLNGYFIFTNPSEFVQRFIPVPEQEEWQLLHDPSTFEKYKQDIFTTPEFYKQNLTFGNSIDSCILESQQGICNIEIRVPTEKVDRFLADFELDVRLSESKNTGGTAEYGAMNNTGQNSVTGKQNATYENRESDDKPNVKKEAGNEVSDLTRCVIMSRVGGFTKGIMFEVRFPKEGEYVFSIYGGDRKVWNDDPPLLCSFILVCKQVNNKIPKQLTFDPGLFGWGPGPMTRRAGFLMPSHETGVIKLTKGEQVCLHFQVISRKYIFVAMPQRKNTKATINECFSFEEVRFEQTERRELSVTARVPPGEEEYTLRIATSNHANGVDKDFICNYFLSTTTEVRREKPKQKETRREIRKVHIGLDLQKLKECMQKTETFEMDPNDEDVIRLKRRIQFLESTAILKEARERNNIGFSKKALKRIENTPFAGILRSDMEYVTKMMRKQEERGWRHEIPTMHPDDLAQIVRMQHPHQEIQDVMNAVCHLLGERPREPKESEKTTLWNKIQVILKFPVKTIDKMKTIELDVKNNGKTISLKIKKKVHELLDGVSVDKLRHVDNSLVTYYNWAQDILQHAKVPPEVQQFQISVKSPTPEPPDTDR